MFEDRLRELLNQPRDVLELDGARFHAPTAAEVIALGESVPMTPVLVEQLDALDPTALPLDQRIGLAVAQQRVANRADANRALAVAATVAACPDERDAPRELQASAQLGAALGLGSGAADTLVAASCQFADALPGTRAMALAGDLPWRKVSTLALATVGMTAAQIARVEAKVLPKAAGRSPAAHDAAVRRAVEQVDPGKADRDRNDAQRDIRMAVHHYGAGMAQVFLDMPSEWAEVTKLAANAYARRLKAAGDPRTLDVLRAHYFYTAGLSTLSHGDPAYCDHHCDPLPPDPRPDEPLPPEQPESFTNHDDDEPTETPPPTSSPSSPPPSAPPTQHGRPVALHVVWDLTSLLGLTSHCGELRDSGTLLPPSAMRDLLQGGARIRRMVIDPNTGEQLDLTPRSWDLPPTDSRAHRQPVVLTITTTERLEELPADLRAALDACDPAFAAMLRELLDYPLTADDLDNTPDAETPSAALAEFTASRAGHPVNPCAGPTAASAADIDHHEARSAGGQTIRANLGPLVRRWHRLKTFTDWTVQQVKRRWEWTSPTGRTYTIEPHDYRLGP